MCNIKKVSLSVSIINTNLKFSFAIVFAFMEIVTTVPQTLGASGSGSLPESESVFDFFRNSALIDSEEDSDVIFLVGQEPHFQRVPAHTWILAKRSPGNLT
jgi:hypothetical protein